MKPELIGLIGIIALLLLVMLRVKVGIALMIVGFVGYIFLTDLDVALAQLGSTGFKTASNYGLSVMPMFILMGMFLSYSGLAKDLFEAVDRWIGHFRGGVAMATVGAAAVFSSISGSVNATTATIAKVALPEMKHYKYDPRISTACVAAGGTLGSLIPPSVILILYGILTLEPIGQLLIAGLVPGVLLAIVFMITVNIQIRRNPSLAATRSESAPFVEKIKSLRSVWPFMLIFTISIGGIYFGFFTATEAGAVGAVGALLFAILTRSLSWSQFVESIKETISLTTMIFLILIGATLFGKFLAISQLPMYITSFVAASDLSPYIILLFVLIVYFVIGLFMEGIAIMVLTLPITHPLITSLGFDGVWFGVMIVILLNIGLLTPPVGLSVFIISGVAKDIPIQTIFRGVIPMLVAMVVFTILLVIFPDIVMLLPKMMR